MTTTTSKPVDAVRMGYLEASIWRNTTSQGQDRFNVTFSRKYRDDQGAWKSSTSFGRDDLLRLGKLADLAETRIFQMQAKEREQAPQQANGRSR